MTRVVGVRFQEDGKMQYYNAGGLDPHAGDYVIAETGHGHDLGEIVMGVNEIEETQNENQLPRVVRIATAQDIQQATENRAREREAYHVCQRKIQEHKLDMKLVSVESTFDRAKMMFYFTANGRVDFRGLVKDLASTFKTRIELRQIGVRDEARMLGGLVPCGRPICCGAFLNDFQPVSIKMAKEQNLSLNPTKISGVCGRLMCCLKYEQDQYEQTRKRMPRIGRDVITPDGRGTVTDLNVVKETVSVRIPNGDSTEIREYPLDQLTRPGAENTTAAERRMEKNPEDEMEARDAERAEDAPIEEDGHPATEDQQGQTGEKPEAAERETRRGDQQRRNRPDRGGRKGSKPSRSNGEAQATVPGSQRFGPRKTESEIAEENPSAAAEGENRAAEEGQNEGQNEARKPGQNRDASRGRRDGNRGNRRGGDAKLGQPVRRENPDREKNPRTQASAGSETADERHGAGELKADTGNVRAESPKPAATESMPKPEGGKAKSKGWADALEKAMQAAEK